MKKPNFFQRIYKSLAEPAFFIYVLKEHFLRAFAYLFILTTLLSIPFTTKTAFEFNRYLGVIQHVLLDPASPEFLLDDKGLTFQSDTPYAYTDDALDIRVILDPIDSYTINDLAGYTTGYLFTSEGITYSQPGLAPQTMPYTLFPVGFSMDKATMAQMMAMSGPMSVALLFLMVLFLTIAYILFLSLFSATMVYFSKSMMGLAFTFSQAYKIGIYGMTGPLLVIGFLGALPFDISTDALFFIFIFLNGIAIARNLRIFITTDQE